MIIKTQELLRRIFDEGIQRNLAIFWVGVGIIVTLFALVTGYLAVNRWIDEKIDVKINDSGYIRKITSTIRPSVIFDQKGSILAEMGAMDHIDDIKISKSKEGLEIKVSPKRFLALAPILECLDGSYEVRHPPQSGWLDEWGCLKGS